MFSGKALALLQSYGGPRIRVQSERQAQFMDSVDIIETLKERGILSEAQANEIMAALEE